MKRAWQQARELKLTRLVETGLVVLALFYGYQGNQKANDQADRAVTQGHESCLRAQRGIPVLVKGLKAQQRAQVLFPEYFPPALQVTREDIRYYESLRPAKC